MPSASSKPEKPPTSVALDPLQQAIIIVEHKIRNLEKRRSKLESYKGNDKYLSKDQIEAVSRYDEVVHHLELSKEYVKQFKVISVENDKLKKKLARRDARDKYASHKFKVRQVLQIQNVLQSMGSAKVREDFLTGQNGAVQLTENDLKLLSDLYIEVSSKKISDDDTTVSNEQFQKAAEIYLAIVEGKPKEIAGSSGAKLKELFASIHASSYFSQPKPEINSTASTENSDDNVLEKEKCHKNQEILSNVIVPNQNSQEGNLPPIGNTPPVPQMIPGGPILPAGSQPPLLQPNQQPILPPNIVPTPVSQVESSFFNAQGLKPPAPPNVIPPPSQNSRQINDVIQSVAGKFNFLQESELDLAEINPGVVPGNPPMAAPTIPGVGPSSIPSQTFTNQNFNGPPGGTPTYPPNYPPQPAAFQNFVPAFPAFVPPNASSVQNANTNANSAIPATVAPVNNTVNSNLPSSNCNINNSTNKCNNIPNSIPMAPNRNSSVNFSQSQQQMSTVYPNHQNSQNLPQPSKQPGFQHGNMTIGSIEAPKIDETVLKENEVKEKPVPEKQDWSQTESTHWADEWTETSEWNPPNQNHSDGASSTSKFASGRVNRNGVPRNTNGYQGNKNRNTRPGGGFRESQNNQGPGGSGNGNFYQNGYQSRNDRNYDFSMTGKGNTDFRDGRFRDRGGFNSRDRDNYGGSFKRPPMNRGPNMKGPDDRGDRQDPIQRNNPGGPRGPRNLNRQPGGRNGSSFQRPQTDSAGQPTSK